jgi:glucosylceramidase
VVRQYRILVGVVAVAALVGNLAAAPPHLLRWWLTTEDAQHQLAEQPSLVFVTVENQQQLAGAIVVDDSRKFQTILGLGSSLEHSTCFNLSQLPPKRRAEVIERLFDPATGIGINLSRICIGTPDFTPEPWYSYDDAGKEDLQLTEFSIEKDRRYVLPILKQVQATYPDVLFFASPWSPPGWMKSTGNMIGGRLLPKNYEVYAQYFVRFLQAYRQEGIPIHAVTVQNEPGVDRSQDDPTWHYPSCRYTGEEERDFIKHHLGPALAKAGLTTNIWSYDHNFNTAPSFAGDDPGIAYPRAVLSDAEAARYVAGVAFHGYVGKPAGMSQFLREFPQVPVHFTEGSVFGPEGGRLLIEYLQNGASSYNGWVTILDEAGKPNNGPFSASRTCITLNPQKDDVAYHYDYFQYGHFFRFLRPGGQRIEALGGDKTLAAAAALNPEGQIATVVVNSGNQPRDIVVIWRNLQATTKLPARSVATLCWMADQNVRN